MKRKSNVRYWQVSIAMVLFGALAACSGANIDENGNASTESVETSENADSVKDENDSNDISSSAQSLKVRKCKPLQVCCEPLPNGGCNLCRSDYRYCP